MLSKYFGRIKLAETSGNAVHRTLVPRRPDSLIP